MTWNLSLVEFLGGDFLIIFSFWLSLHLGLSVFLLDILLGLFLFIHSRVFISSCCLELAFPFLYIENTKILGILHWWHLIFRSLSLILVHVKKYCIFFRIPELNWKLHFEKHIIYWELKLGLCIVFIFIYFTCWVITSLISRSHLFE